MEDLLSAAPSRRILLFTTGWCAQCTRAKELLALRGLDFEGIDAEAIWGEAFREEIERRTGGRTVPQIVIDGRPVGGYDALLAMEQRGDLRRLAAGESTPPG